MYISYFVIALVVIYAFWSDSNKSKIFNDRKRIAEKYNREKWEVKELLDRLDFEIGNLEREGRSLENLEKEMRRIDSKFPNESNFYFYYSEIERIKEISGELSELREKAKQLDLMSSYDE
ncbi:hypothetical protein JX85_23660 [Salmonella enterica]|nr:hypothetical protein [Salmonella enterica]